MVLACKWFIDHTISLSKPQLPFACKDFQIPIWILTLNFSCPLWSWFPYILCLQFGFIFLFLNFEQLCTLEFETRRASYYWLLHALGIYQPYVWEYSRLNITNTVMSKRKVSNISLESLKFELYLLFCDKSNYWYACCFS